MAVGGSASRDSGKDKRIFVRVFGRDKIYWYVIEEKSAIDVDDGNTMIGCESDNDDRVRCLSFLCSDLDKYEEASIFSSNVAVVNSTVYLIGGNVQKKNKGASRFNDDEYIAYRRFDDLDLGVGEWQPDGGSTVKYQGGGAVVGPDGNIYTVGYNIYRFSPRGNCKFHEELISPPSIKEPRLLGVTRKKVLIYTIEGGVDGANRMLSFDLESGKWDILDDYSNGDWSAGVVLYDDLYLFSFCSQNPTRQEEAEVPGIYVFDIERCVWLPEPVEGLPTDGKVLPLIYTPDPNRGQDLFLDTTFSAFLLQIGKQEEHKLALLWDGHGTHPETRGPQVKLVWSKFVLKRSTSSAADQYPHFYADSVSSGLCPLDDYTFDLINCAAGM
ncbi:hypothetical protein ACLB2K_044997 [Fragaria x ananassa]